MKIDISKYLARKSYSTNFIPEIDGLRFLAILTVVLFHLQTHYFRTIDANFKFEGITKSIHYLISKGGLGVNVFFGISGFILALPFAKRYFNNQKVALKPYFIRRLTRLEPPFIISLIVLLIAQIVYFHTSFQELQSHFVASLFYVHFLVFGTWSTINPVTWSLETEVQFYIIAPLLFLIFKQVNFIVRHLYFIGLIAVSILSTFFFKTWLIEHHLHKSLLVYLPYFILGALFAEYYIVQIHKKVKNKSHVWDLFGITATIGLFIFHDNSNDLYKFLQLAFLFIVFISTFRGKILNWFYTRKIIYTIGGMCYSIYLIHYALIAFLVKYSAKISFSESYIVNMMTQIVLVIPVILIASAIFFTFFEKPFMYKDWPKKFLHFFTPKTTSK